MEIETPDSSFSDQITCVTASTLLSSPSGYPLEKTRSAPPSGVLGAVRYPVSKSYVSASSSDSTFKLLRISGLNHRSRNTDSFRRAHGYAFCCSNFIVVGIVPDTNRAHGFIFCIQRHIEFRYSEIVDSVRGNSEAETATIRICNFLFISVINNNIIIHFASALVALNLDDFSGLVLADGEIPILPYVLPYLFCQRCSSRDCVVAQLGRITVANAQCCTRLALKGATDR